MLKPELQSSDQVLILNPSKNTSQWIAIMCTTKIIQDIVQDISKDITKSSSEDIARNGSNNSRKHGSKDVTEI